MRADGLPTPSWPSTARRSASAPPSTSTPWSKMSELVGLLGILASLGLLIGLSFRGWSVLLLAPLSALVAAAISGQPLLASLTQLFMTGAAGFLAQFFPIFLLGALFGKLMDDSGAVRSIAQWMILRLGQKRAVLSVVVAGAFVT